MFAGVTVIVPVAFTDPQPPVNGMLYVNVPDAVGVPLIVITFDAHVALTPAGNPFAPDTPEFEIPVAPVVVLVMLVNTVLIHSVGFEDAVPAVFAGVTVIVPVAFTDPQPPVNGMLYANVPDAVGVPLIVITFDAHVALTPAGNPFAPDTPEFEIPVAPVVVCVIAVNAVLIHNVGVVLAAVEVLVAVTVTVIAPLIVAEHVGAE